MIWWIGLEISGRRRKKKEGERQQKRASWKQNLGNFSLFSTRAFIVFFVKENYRGEMKLQRFHDSLSRRPARGVGPGRVHHPRLHLRGRRRLLRLQDRGAAAAHQDHLAVQCECIGKRVNLAKNNFPKVFFLRFEYWHQSYSFYEAQSFIQGFSSSRRKNICKEYRVPR